METLQTVSNVNPRGKLVPIPGRDPALPLRQLFPSKVMNLAELSRCICAHRHLRRCVVEAARREPGWIDASVEEAIVLLGQRRLRELVADAEGESSPHTSPMPVSSSGQCCNCAEGKLL